MRIILDKYPFPITCPYNVPVIFPTGINLIKFLLKRIDKGKIDSSYLSSMVESLDRHLVNQLYAFLTQDEIESWKMNPNNQDILDFIDEQGYTLYNHFYLGNDGYEDTLRRANPHILYLLQVYTTLIQWIQGIIILLYTPTGQIDTGFKTVV